jgi:hypothetical protein
MDIKTRAIFLGHVKVEVRSRSPKLWGWDVCLDGSGTVVERSEALFRHAEDAWREGREMLASLEDERGPRQARPCRVE